MKLSDSNLSLSIVFIVAAFAYLANIAQSPPNSFQIIANQQQKPLDAQQHTPESLAAHQTPLSLTDPLNKIGRELNADQTVQEDESEKPHFLPTDDDWIDSSNSTLTTKTPHALTTEINTESRNQIRPLEKPKFPTSLAQSNLSEPHHSVQPRQKPVLHSDGATAAKKTAQPQLASLPNSTTKTISSSNPLGRSTTQPRRTWIWRLAHQDYCLRNPSDCGVFTSSPLVNWNAEKSTIETTWRDVWESFWPTDDVGGDLWGIGQDCEDYALKLRSELIALGIPRYHMLIATGLSKEHKGKNHAVLVIRTNDGWKVADSLFSRILDRRTADRVFACKSMEDPDRGTWASCEEATRPIYAGF